MQTNILEYFTNGAALHFASKTAIVEPEHSYTFAELERYAKRCATLLLRRADVINQPIAVYLPKCSEVVFANLGIVYSGNIYANLDIKSPPQRTKGILDNIAPALIVSSRALASQLRELGICDERIVIIEDIYNESIECNDAVLLQRLERIIDTDPLCLIHTSGSTGLPKGVALHHRGTIDFMDWCFRQFNFHENERIGSLSPFYFDIYTLELILCITKGATIVIIPEETAIFPAKLVEFLANQKISFIFWVPSVMVNIAKQGILERFDLSALRTIFFAGEVFPTKHLNSWRRMLPHASFVNLYGPIEIHVDCTYFRLDREFKDDEQIPIGFPCRNTDILILNENNLLAKAGEQGELCIRGSSVALGYWNDPAKTSQAFVQNPLNPHYPELIYRTGDIVFRNERGEIMLVGRKDFQIKHLGYRIELPEIEYQVLRIPEISNACVVYNKDKKEITLFYETLNSDCDPAMIRKKLLEILPKYMLPTAYHRMPELPRNPNGKVDRNLLSMKLEGKI